MKLSDIDTIVSKVFIGVVTLGWAAGTFYAFGSYIEQKFFKVRIDQAIENVQYDKTNGYLCWDWYSTKVRAKPATNMGVILHDADDKKVLLTTFNRYTKTPWQLSNPIALGKVNQPLCTFIPPGYVPKPPFVVNQYVEYPGLLNFWNLTTRLPTIRYDEKNDTAPTIEDKKEQND